MPFPWKKVKSTRLTQWVNDHLHKSQKRRDGSSLVVETGFPASLIDLFIKNREKLKNSSKKKCGLSQSQSVSLNDFHDPVTVGSPTNFSTPLQCHSPVNSPLNSTLIVAFMCSPSSCPSQNTSLLPLPKLAAANVSGDELVDRDGGIGVQTKRGIEKGVDAKGVISAVAKIFIVVVLALTTKSLTVGITISGFLLLFMECTEKHLSGFAKSCIKAKEWLRFSVTLSCSKRDTVNLENDVVFLLKSQQEEEKSSQTEDISMRNCDSKCVFQEIEIVEQKYSVSSIEEIQSEKEIDSCSERWSVKQDNYSNFVMEKEYTGEAVELKRKSRKDKLKLKMRRLVPKKFGSSRTENNLVVSKNDKDSNVYGHEEQVSSEFEYEESEIGSTLSAVSSCRYRVGYNGHIGDVIARLPEIVEVASVKVEMAEEKETGVSWMHFVLCVTVLIGLIGGRAFAFGLTLLLILLMKLGKTLQKFGKRPTIVSSNENSG